MFLEVLAADMLLPPLSPEPEAERESTPAGVENCQFLAHSSAFLEFFSVFLTRTGFGVFLRCPRDILGVTVACSGDTAAYSEGTRSWSLEHSQRVVKFGGIRSIMNTFSWSQCPFYACLDFGHNLLTSSQSISIDVFFYLLLCFFLLLIMCDNENEVLYFEMGENIKGSKA